MQRAAYSDVMKGGVEHQHVQLFWQNEAKKISVSNASSAGERLALSEFIDENGGGHGARLRKRHQKKG
jgi:hypothetical protein